MERVLAVVMCYLPNIKPHWRSVRCLIQNTVYMYTGCLDLGADLLIAKLISVGFLPKQLTSISERKLIKVKPNLLPEGKNDY